MARFKLGFDFWECPCGVVVAVGRRCWKCGGSYADVLQAEAKAERQPKKREKKYRAPANSGEFVDSYLFREKKGKNI